MSVNTHGPMGIRGGLSSMLRGVCMEVVTVRTTGRKCCAFTTCCVFMLESRVFCSSLKFPDCQMNLPGLAITFDWGWASYAVHRRLLYGSIMFCMSGAVLHSWKKAFFYCGYSQKTEHFVSGIIRLIDLYFQYSHLQEIFTIFNPVCLCL